VCSFLNGHWNTGERTIPEAVLRLPSLTSLNIAGNGFSTLPADLFASLSSLEVLDVSHNSLSSLPDGIANCTGLRVLTLMANILTALPRGIAQVSSLQELHARCVCYFNVSYLYLYVIYYIKFSILNSQL
jgi:Leucine-rich repeat (LRR) protein